MSRSKRKTSIHGITTAESEKADKLAAHRKYRRTLKQMLEAGLDTPSPVERELRTVSMAIPPKVLDHFKSVQAFNHFALADISELALDQHKPNRHSGCHFLVR